MVKENRHSTAIPADVVEQAKAKALELHELLLPYMTTTLTALDRRRLLKMGPKTLDFVGTAFEEAKNNPQILPVHLSVEEFEVDYTDAQQLYSLQSVMDTVRQGVADLVMVAGSEAHQAALVVYQSAKLAAAQKILGAKVAFEKMKSKYPKGKGKRRTTTEEPGAEEA